MWLKIEMESSGGRQAPHGGQDYHAPPPVSTLALRAHARIKGGSPGESVEGYSGGSRYARTRESRAAPPEQGSITSVSRYARTRESRAGGSTEPTRRVNPRATRALANGDVGAGGACGGDSQEAVPESQLFQRAEFLLVGEVLEPCGHSFREGAHPRAPDESEFTYSVATERHWTSRNFRVVPCGSVWFCGYGFSRSAPSGRRRGARPFSPALRIPEGSRRP